MKILVTGGREYNDYATVCRALDEMNPTEIIHGGCSGADKLAGRYAREKGLVEHVFKAQWRDLSHPDANIRQSKGGPYDSKAGPRRNQQMLEEGHPDVVMAFPGGHGTADMVRRAKEGGVHVITIGASVYAPASP